MNKPGIMKEVGGRYELTVDKIDHPEWNPDLHPVPVKHRTWSKLTMASLWVAMCINITVYMLGSSLISSGMNWWQAVVTILLGNIIVLIPMALIGHPGTKYGIPFPVLIRSCFGINGAKFAAMLRAFVACGWFGIQSCIAGDALYLIISYVFPEMQANPAPIACLGIDFWRLLCIIIIVLLHILIIRYGIEMIKKVEIFASPFLLLAAIALFAWAWIRIGSFTKVLQASEHMIGTGKIDFFDIFWPGLTAIIGFWSTLALNIPDFTRFVRSQKDQFYGQAYALPTTMALFSFVGIFVTSATIILFGNSIWDPVALVGKFGHNPLLILPLFGIILATFCCNVAANIVSPANDFSNLVPRLISFRTGGYITCVIGIAILPWKLIADPNGYIFKWLIAYSSLLGAIGGVMIADYYIIRDKVIDLVALYSDSGAYIYTRGWNIRACISVLVAAAPNIPGFLMRTGIVVHGIFPLWMEKLYDYAWFISFFISFIIYTFLMLGRIKLIRKKNDRLYRKIIR